MGLLKCEKETVILLNDAEKKASISTSQDWMQKKLRKLAEIDPENVKITGEDKYTILAEVPSKYVSIRIPRKLSDEQREKMIERLRPYWKKNNK